MQEEELEEAKQLYAANLESVQEALAADPDNVDLMEVGGRFNFSIPNEIFQRFLRLYT